MNDQSWHFYSLEVIVIKSCAAKKCLFIIIIFKLKVIKVITPEVLCASSLNISIGLCDKINVWTGTSVCWRLTAIIPK